MINAYIILEGMMHFKSMVLDGRKSIERLKYMRIWIDFYMFQNRDYWRIMCKKAVDLWHPRKGEKLIFREYWLPTTALTRETLFLLANVRQVGKYSDSRCNGNHNT
jgi:hypothetical protein